MERRKRKNSTIESSYSKRARNYEDSIETEHLILIRMEVRKLQKKILNSENKCRILEEINKDLEKDSAYSNKILEDKIDKMDKKIKRVEKFNQELREKNLALEEELQNKKEMEICDEFNNNISLVEPYSYIS
jgi:hypothetical protein